MITNILIATLGVLITFFINLFPGYGGLPAAATSALDTGLSAMRTFSVFFPVSDLVLILGLVMSFEIGIALFKIINWTYDKIRGAG